MKVENKKALEKMEKDEVKQIAKLKDAEETLRSLQQHLDKMNSKYETIQEECVICSEHLLNERYGLK